MLHGVAGMLGIGLTDYEALSLPHHPLGTLVDAADVAATVLRLASGSEIHHRSGRPGRRGLHDTLGEGRLVAATAALSRSQPKSMPISS